VANIKKANSKNAPILTRNLITRVVKKAVKVIKPTLTGSLAKVREQVAAAHALGLTAVISSSIESSLGLTQLARIAAWLTPDTIPGLDTLNLMQAQLIRRWPDSALPCLNVAALEPLL